MSAERPSSAIAAAAVTLMLCGIGFLLSFIVAVVWAAWGGR